MKSRIRAISRALRAVCRQGVGWKGAAGWQSRYEVKIGPSQTGYAEHRHGVSATEVDDAVCTHRIDYDARNVFQNVAKCLWRQVSFTYRGGNVEAMQLDDVFASMEIVNRVLSIAAAEDKRIMAVRVAPSN
jgi:hypothetical protein